jgi:superfamily II DNA or RNA helicase
MLGITATPDRGDARNLGRFFEDIAFEIGLVDLIRAGFLCPIKVRTVPVNIDISNVLGISPKRISLKLLNLFWKRSPKRSLSTQRDGRH